MARYQLILAYDGTQYAGSQRQAGRKTVQGELEKALQTLGWKGRSVLIAGRTDSGVHAEGQSVALDFEWKHGAERLRAALNAKLPAELAVRAVREVSPDFHPRFDALSRRYRYRLFCDSLRQPVRERFAWRIWPEVEGAALQTAATFFLGRHDFAAFGSAPRPSSSTVRTVLSSVWTELQGEWQYEVQADAFLYRMVRRQVFVQVAVAQGRLEAATVRQAIEKQVPLPAGLAPACGLSLMQVNYAESTMKIEMQVE